MPYNFEATFVQPLLAKLDNGVIKGADDWAHAITNAYIATIKTGLPQGVPTTLPAPGLNPTAPPPYPIGTSPFTTTNVKGTAMYNVIHAYFLAKEISLEKGAIDSLASTVKQMILKIKRRYYRIKQLTELVRSTRDELKSKQLEAKKNALVAELRYIMQPKLIEIQKRLQTKIKELTSRLKNSKAASLYKNANKSIADLKRVYNEKIKNTKERIKLGKKIVKKATSIGIKIDTLYVGVLSELKNAKSVLLKGNENVSKTYTQLESEKLQNYLSRNDLSSIANIATLVLLESKCSFVAFKSYFERNSKIAKLYVEEVQSLNQDFKDLSKLVKEFKDKSQGIVEAKKTKSPDWLSLRIKSLKDLINFITKTTQPFIHSIKADINKELGFLKTFVDTQLTKAREDIKVFAINLIPLKSDIVDKKDKVAVAESKRIALKHKIARGKDLALLYSYYLKAIKGLTGILDSVAHSADSLKPISLSENRNNIDKVLTGYLLLKSQKKDQAEMVDTKIEHIKEDRIRLIKKFDRLIVLELLTLGLVNSLKDIKNSPFLEELQNFCNELNTASKNSLNTFINLCKNPPTKISELLAVVNSMLVVLMQDRVVANKILALELKYLQKSRTLVSSLVDVNKSSSSDAQVTLLKVKNELDKNRSFIKMGFQLLARELKQFFNFLNSLVIEVVDFAKKKLDAKKEKIKKQYQDILKKQKEKQVNSDAALMTVLFGIAARSFWTGTRWTGPTGTQHISLNIGVFTRIKARSTDGASATIREMARGFQNQLTAMQGLVIPPANTGIPPIPFIGYK